MAVQPLRGFRDYYPEDQAKITYLRTKIAEVCGLFGYEEFEGPAVEPFSLYAAKSSDEIVNEQAFVFEDRGGDKITLRPELTPTLARMIAGRQGQLIFPVRWWSFGRFWRYERPQKGRGREFYQWNCDLLGDDTIGAEIEILEIVVRFLQSLGLTPQDASIDLNDRAFTSERLKQGGITDAQMEAAMRFIDRAPKLSAEEQPAYAQKLGLSDKQFNTIQTLITDTSSPSPTITAVTEQLKQKGLGEWAQFNPTIVRGFNYYTGLVFEVSDRDKNYRAMLGGGRYSNLVEQVGGKPISGIGFGMGDMVLLNFLEEKGLLPEYKPAIQAVVIALDDSLTDEATAVADKLRQSAIPTLFYGTTKEVGKALKFTNQKQATYAVLLGQNEAQAQQVTVKNMETSDQTTTSLDEAIQTIKG